MQCPQCQQENPPQAKFCLACGVRLTLACSACGTELPAGARFCLACGQPVQLPDTVQSRPAAPVAYTPKHLAEKILTSRSALEGERKQVTVLFCDLANSTALAERLGPETMHTLLNHFFELALAEVHRYEGTINQFLGDGFMALFGAPLAHEDHARRAVLAALGVQQRLRQDGVEAESLTGGTEDAPPQQLSMRMGLNTGLVVVGSIGDNLRMDYTAVGDTTNLAARLQQLAQPGTILLSETTARLVRSEARLEALEPVQVKGKTEPVTAWRVLGRLPRRSPLAGREERALSPFVGRERELAALHELLAQVEAGQGQVVGLVGEAGVGKSRLLFEFRQRLRDRRVTYLEGRCLSYGSAIPYLPLMDILRNNAGITEADGPEAIVAKVRMSLQEVSLDPEDGASYLLQLLGVKEGTEPLARLSPEAIKTRTFAILRQMPLLSSQRQPLILAVEDLHWIDQTSEACFASLVESLAGAPLLLLCTYRPGYRPPWLEKSYATQIALRRLTPPDSLAVVHAVLQRALPDPLAQGILDKAEGNPFFLEELTRAVVEHGDLRSLQVVPDTIQGVLAARIDRLSEEPKRLLQTASVLGRELPSRLLSAMWDTPDMLAGYLAELKRLEFLYERTEATELVYVFKHVLTQEVAYDSLLTSRRQALHATAGRALESLYADRLEEVYDRLAYHYARTAESANAIEYLTRFAEKAARGYAHAEAVTALQEALVHAGVRQAAASSIAVQDRLMLDLALRLTHSLYFLGRFQETLDLLLRQQECLGRLQAPVLTGPYYFWLSHTYS
jgi:class 3 adenylate cyclase